MSDVGAVRELLAGLPVPLKPPVHVAELDGGLHNRVYRISSGAGDFVLRLGSKQSGLPDLDCELSMLGQAASAGLGPRVEYADRESGILLLRFVPGRQWVREDLIVAANIEALADLLRRLHELPMSGTRLDTGTIAEHHARIVYARDDLRDFAATCLDVVAQHESSEGNACCHNDVVAANLVAGDVLTLIDWEWAADNDPLFDLASVVAYHDLERGHAERLLGAYAGGVDSSLRERFQAALSQFDALQWLWLAARESRRSDADQLARLIELRSRIST